MNRIKDLRQRNGLTQATLASHLGIAQNTLSYWENGKFEIDNASLCKIADFFHVTTDYLLGRTLEKQEYTNETVLNAHEEKVILAYRSKPSMQPAVDRLLDVDSESSESNGASYIAAAGENQGGGTTHFSKEELAALHSAPETDEDF